jgi:hypothetical protein
MNGKLEESVTSAIKRGVESSKGTGRRIYIGTLDDSVSRYPWKGHEPDLAFLNKLLIDSALFGPPFCARVGNILYHDVYFEALRKPESSPLRAFLKSGFFQMQMRKDTINDTIQSVIAHPPAWLASIRGEH